MQILSGFVRFVIFFLFLSFFLGLLGMIVANGIFALPLPNSVYFFAVMLFFVFAMATGQRQEPAWFKALLISVWGLVTIPAAYLGGLVSVALYGQLGGGTTSQPASTSTGDPLALLSRIDWNQFLASMEPHLYVIVTGIVSSLLASLLLAMFRHKA